MPAWIAPFPHTWRIPCDTPGIHRREARIVAALPPEALAPRLLWTYDEAGWVALCLEDVDGRHPYEPWTEADIELVVCALQKVSAALTPSPIATVETAAQAFERAINGWRIALDRREDRLHPWCVKHLPRLADLEATAPEACAGETLLHFDTRADNMLISGNRVFLVDWPWARTGAAFVDWLAMAPSVAMQSRTRSWRGSITAACHVMDSMQRFAALRATLSSARWSQRPKDCPRCAHFKQRRVKSHSPGCSAGWVGAKGAF